uniref:Uncharacterized protein n=1 Tax=Arundo donax TaxID=35708 RepID=A0A0A9AFZ6_ARUDO
MQTFYHCLLLFFSLS